MLFVYGTLRRVSGHPMHQLLRRHARFIGTATIGGRLYDLGPYPGVVESADECDQVQGEVYRLAAIDRVLRELDRYEGYDEAAPLGSLFIRRTASARLTDNARCPVWVYFFNRPLGAARRIVSGDYYAGRIENASSQTA